MGMEGRDVGFTVALLLDSHGGDKERAHEQLADELAERLSSVMLSVIGDPRYDEIRLFDPEFYAEQVPDKWRQAVTLLAAAKRVIGGEHFGEYVDVSSAVEAVDEVLDYLMWKAYEEAGPAAAGMPIRRVVGGKSVTYTEFWGLPE